MSQFSVNPAHATDSTGKWSAVRVDIDNEGETATVYARDTNAVLHTYRGPVSGTGPWQIDGATITQARCGCGGSVRLPG